MKRFSSLLFIFSLMIIFPLNLQSQNTTLKEAYPNLSFTRPVDFQNAGDGNDRMFVVVQDGIIYVFENNPNVQDRDVFLDIRDRVSSGGERGLLGLAFHPDYKENGYFFVHYTAPGPLRNVISRFIVEQNNANAADVDSEMIIIEIPQPLGNHNGGQIAFGSDGYLYIAIGDGGGAGDPGNNAQDRANLLGTILRIDIDNVAEGMNYSIPPDNPFVGNEMGYREEIFAYGLRNPWRFSFDPVTGWLWCGDVGQSGWEEINIIESGKNYGWNIMEGTHCYPPGSQCDTTGLTMPIWEYEWGVDGRSVTGGYVYRGSTFPDLNGKYVYGDFEFGNIWALLYDGEHPPVNELLTGSNLRISTFGVDEQNEIYFCDYNSGKIYTFDSVSNVKDGTPVPGSFLLYQNYPNPFNPQTTITFELSESRHVYIAVYNVLGEKIKLLANQWYDAGSHSLHEDFSGFPSGVYFYRIRAGDFVDMKSMVLLQ